MKIKLSSNDYHPSNSFTISSDGNYSLEDVLKEVFVRGTKLYLDLDSSQLRYIFISEIKFNPPLYSVKLKTKDNIIYHHPVELRLDEIEKIVCVIYKLYAFA